jgi:hypothetical protein
MKTGNYLYGNNKNASGLHGAQQNNTAIDSYGSEDGKELWLKAGDAGHTERPFDVGSIYEGFHFITDTGVDKLMVHAKYPGQKHFAKDAFITKSAWHHFHRSTYTKNGYRPEHNVSDPNAVTYTSESGQVYPYNTLPKYEDDDALTGLKITLNNSTTEMITLTKTIIHCHAIHTAGPFNVRSEPKVADNKIGEVPLNATWDTNFVASGENVQGVTLWYGLPLSNGSIGWVSGKWVEEVVKDNYDPAIVQQLAELKAKVEGLEASAKVDKETIAKYQPIIEILKNLSGAIAGL